LNGRVSRTYCVEIGVHQGCPISPILFGAYVVDVVAPRIRYGPSVRTMVSSYVDCTTITIAADSRAMASAAAIELFEECSAVAAAQGLNLSALHRQWNGLGVLAWEPVVIGGVRLAPVENITILGYRVNRYLNWSDYVRYWLKRGLVVRNRISAVTRRFGDSARAGAWEACACSWVHISLQSTMDLSL